MEFMWDIPDQDAYKINIHCEISDVPSPVGNTVAIASIIRGPTGDKCWGMEGPANNLTLELVNNYEHGLVDELVNLYKEAALKIEREAIRT
ncbi:hypothetical protein DCAR_0933370 [Daucus carota subsp. sativus]|uniref:Uncharacterized protein n=1 Tax=Daucus carota subsp. sativus TaxID=79200 RepID=A0A175YCT7_DAUCS|nr:hypothetical protein DCAR_0933370 [Daucus carota subsp. sativus]